MVTPSTLNVHLKKEESRTSYANDAFKLNPQLVTMNQDPQEREHGSTMLLTQQILTQMMIPIQQTTTIILFLPRHQSCLTLQQMLPFPKIYQLCRLQIPRSEFLLQLSQFHLQIKRQPLYQFYHWLHLLPPTPLPLPNMDLPILQLLPPQQQPLQ